MSAAPNGVATIQIIEHHFEEEISTNLSLTSDEIHIWQRQLECEPHVIESLGKVLSPDELARARRFHFPFNRYEFIVSRGTLRMLLGQYVACSPENLRFMYSQYGRPTLDAASHTQPVEFNISHSGNVVVLAFARDRRIGIDIELVRRDFSTAEIAERFFSVAEREALRTLPVEQRHEAFFRCWTRKEAFIKALGEGLSRPLDQFDVSLAPELPTALLATRPDARYAHRWSLWNLNVPPGYAGALAAETVPADQYPAS
jgi:4'-phosphopantetheinyl transferase